MDNPELTIRSRSHSDPTLLNNSKMAAEGNSDLPVPDLRTMEELCQPSLNGRGGPIDPIAIQAMKFGLKNDMIQQDYNSCQFHGLLGDDANKHLDKFLHVTQSIKVNGVTDDALHLYLFPHSLTHHSIAWFDRLPRNSINTFKQMAKMFLEKYFPPSMVTKLRNEITNFCQLPDESLFEACERYKLSINRCPNHNMLPVTQIDTFYNGLTLRHHDTINAAAGGTFMKRHPEECCDLTENMTAHHNNWDTSAQRTPVYEAPVHQPQIPQPQVVTTNEFTNFIKANDVILKNMQTNMTSLTNSKLELKNMFGQFMKMNTALSLGSRTLLGNTITNPKEDLEGITTRRGTAYPGPTIPTTTSSPVVEHFDADPRVPLILRRSFLKIGRALIDVFEWELTLRVGKEAITFNLDQTSRYSTNYSNMMANCIDVIDMACEEYSQEVLGFFDVIDSGNPTPYYDPIVSTTSPTLTPFGNSNFLLEEVDAFLAIEYDPSSPRVDQSYLNTERDIILLEAFLNDDPSLPPPNQGNYLLEVRKELKIYEAKSDKSSIDEPSWVELKDLPPHLEYAFRDSDDKFPVIIMKDLSVEEKTLL
nr:reverse transcriptase domain-containing protein [Tanacetum cinerariifolium]GFA00842.1 reverse transcriptase domain-containing protein [Tanacetum cinerariifolium]